MKNNIVKKIDIDLVYLWVDGSDPNWLAKRNAFIGNVEENTSAICKGRFANNDELKYSLRSVEKYAPWIRKIFIVTDNQTPDWLDTKNPKIKVVDHKDIIPQKCLPCFNPMLIEHFIYKITDLSEHFIFANDDMFINKPISPDIFFAEDGFPIIRLNYKIFRRLRIFWRERIRKKPLHQYRQTVVNARQLVEKRYGKYFNGAPHHNIDAYLKSNCQKTAEEIFKKELEATFVNHLRNNNDIQRIIYSYVALAEKRGYLHYVSKKDSFHVQIYRENDYKKLVKYNPTLFCMNDSPYADDKDRERLKKWLDNYFPEKSAFEK